MDWLRQIPMGQFVDGREGWLRRLDARLKLAWSLVFLLTPVLAGPLWRVALGLGLLLLTLISGLPRRIWWRSLLVLTRQRKLAKYTKIQNPESGMPTEGTASHLMKGCI